MGQENGNIVLAKPLDWETQHMYNLTISVTDGVHTVYTQVKDTIFTYFFFSFYYL